MPRRISLAVALAFTTVVTFALIAIGAQAGVFSESKPSNADAAVEEAPAAAPQVAAASAEAPASVEPQVIVETEYVDVIDPAPPAAGAPAQPAASETAKAAAAGATKTPVATKTAKATATAASAATATAVPPKPTATGAALPPEIEFVGSVTAIAGNKVTFNHGGTLTTVQVSNPGALEVGDTAHVHALLKPGGYVATEVTVGG